MPVEIKYFGKIIKLSEVKLMMKMMMMISHEELTTTIWIRSHLSDTDKRN